MALTPSLMSKTPTASNDSEPLTEGQRLAMADDLIKAARYTLVSMNRQSIGRIALKYRHIGSPYLKEIAKPSGGNVIYGPRFALMHRYVQAYVMARESLRHAMGQVLAGALHYKREPRNFSFKVWSMACDSIDNHILENLVSKDNTSSSISYGVRRCEELGIVKWDDVKRSVSKIAKSRGVEVGEVFSKEPNELTSQMIYQAIMRVARAVAEAQKGQRDKRTWTHLMTIFDKTIERVVEDPKTVLKDAPVRLGAIELYDAFAGLVRTYNESAYPADHSGSEDVDLDDWKLLSEAVHALVRKASSDPTHAFTTSPTRRSLSLWNDVVALLKEFVNYEPEHDEEIDHESVIEEIAEEMNLIETMQEAIEELSRQPEANLMEKSHRAQESFRRMQSSAGSVDAILSVAPVGGMTRTPWRQALAAMASSALVTRFSMDPTKPSRRAVASMRTARIAAKDGKPGLVYHQPKLIRHAKAKKAWLLIDSSGSIFCDRQIMEQFLSEAMSLCKRVNTVLTVVFADAAVCDVVEVGEAYDMIRTMQPKGGGATDFRPAIALAEESSPDLIIYATDLMGTFPESKPKCPLIWAIPPEFEHIETPFGRRLILTP